MGVFLVNWIRPEMRNLHRNHLVRAFEKDDRFERVDFRLAEPREAGKYRVIGHTKTRWITDDPSYPATDARFEVGFKKPRETDGYQYWINWIEPERSVLLGWHRDDDHPEYGPVHKQIQQADSVVARESAEVVGENPGAIFYGRLEQLPETIATIEWDDEQAVGFTDRQ